MILGLISILEVPMLIFYSHTITLAGKTFQGPSIGIIGIVITTIAVIVNGIAYNNGERSWVMWLGFVPALLMGLFWSIMIIAEIISIIFNLRF